MEPFMYALSFSDASTGAQCPLTDWRLSSLVSNPTPTEEFWPLRRDYFLKNLVKAAWVTIVGASLCTILTIGFLTWRVIRPFKMKSKSKTDSLLTEEEGHPHEITGNHEALANNSKQLSFLQRRRVIQSIQALIGIFSCGSIAGSIYGMIRMDASLVDYGIKSIYSVSSYVDNGLDVVQEMAASGILICDSLQRIETLIIDEVNVQEIASNITCLGPWLSDLPNPQDIQNHLDNATASITEIIDGLTELIEGSESLVKFNAVSNAFEGHLVDLLNSKDILDIFEMQLAEASTKCFLVDPSSGVDEVIIQDVLDAIQNLTNTPSIAAKLEAMQATALALSAIRFSIIDMNDQLDGLLSEGFLLLSSNGSLKSLSNLLNSQVDSYQLSKPCIDTLKDKALFINSSIVQLPEDFSSYFNMLFDVEDEFGFILNLSGNSSDGNSLDAAIDEAETNLNYAAALSAVLTLVESKLNETDSLVQDIETVYISFQNMEDSLQSISDNITSFLLDSPNALSYVELAQLIQVAGNSMVSLSSNMQAWKNESAELYDNGRNLLETLSENDLMSLIDSFQMELQNVLPDNGFMSIYQESYEKLPNDLNDLLSNMTEILQTLTSDAIQALDGPWEAMGNALESLEQDVDEFRQQSVGELQGAVNEYEPVVRKYDMIRQAVIYSVFLGLAVLSLLMMIASFATWGIGLKYILGVKLLMSTLCFLIVVLLTMGLKFGADGCTNLEAVLEQVMVDGDPRVSEMLRFYLLKEESNLTDVLSRSFGVNITDSLDKIADGRQSVIALFQQYTLGSLLMEHINTALAASYGIEETIDELLYLVSQDEVHLLYMSLKSFPCCRALDAIGSLWTGLLVSCSMISCAAILGMILLSRIEGTVEKPSCCQCCIPLGRPYQESTLRNNTGHRKNRKDPVISIRAVDWSSNASFA